MKTKTYKQILWTQDWGTFEPRTVVCCGFDTYEEIVKIMDDDKCPQWSRAISARLTDLNDLSKNNHFTKWTMSENGNEITYSVLWLKDWKKDQEHYKILAHELIHAISFHLGPCIDLIKENELFAYQHTYLFNAISNKLNAAIKKK